MLWNLADYLYKEETSAEEAREQARLRLEKLSAADPAYLQARQDLDRALTRVRVASRAASR